MSEEFRGYFIKGKFHRVTHVPAPDYTGQPKKLPKMNFEYKTEIPSYYTEESIEKWAEALRQKLPRR